MSDYKDWDNLIDDFEISQGFKGYKSDKIYYVSLISWLKRNHLPPLKNNDEIKIGNFVIFKKSLTVIIDSHKEIRLSRRVFDLLVLFVSNPDKVFTRKEILEIVWEKGICVIEKTVDVHINRIRKLLGKEIILTHVGVGYRINLDFIKKEEGQKTSVIKFYQCP